MHSLVIQTLLGVYSLWMFMVFCITHTCIITCVHKHALSFQSESPSQGVVRKPAIDDMDFSNRSPVRGASTSPDLGLLQVDDYTRKTIISTYISHVCACTVYTYTPTLLYIYIYIHTCYTPTRRWIDRKKDRYR